MFLCRDTLSGYQIRIHFMRIRIHGFENACRIKYRSVSGSASAFKTHDPDRHENGSKTLIVTDLIVLMILQKYLFRNHAQSSNVPDNFSDPDLVGIVYYLLSWIRICILCADPNFATKKLTTNFKMLNIYDLKFFCHLFKRVPS